MTKPMTDSDLADIRNTLERATISLSEIHARHITEDGAVIPLATIDIDDVRALVARLDQERAKAIEECLEIIEAVEDKADEWEWAIDAIRDRLSDLKDGKP